MQARQIVFAVVLLGSVTPAAGEAQQSQARQADLRDRQEQFRAMDRNSDGIITRAEWRGNIQSFRRLDANRDGLLSGNEVWVDSGRGSTREGEGDRLPFADLDRNANGVITRGEWRGTIEEFRALDVDGDGVVTAPEYRDGRDAANSPAYRAGRERGLIDGRQAGREDKTINGGQWDLDGQRELETADAGYNESVGRREQYQAGYRNGFRQGYREGFGPR
jgi:hypothetical protein